MAKAEITEGVVSRMYRRAQALHGGIPYHLSPWGHALPAWHYFFEVTRRCNLRCRMCQYINWFDRHSPQDLLASELTTDEWRGVIAQTGRLSLITFTGGEPFVRDDFAELLEYASRGRRTHVITNGTRLAGEGAQQCVALAPQKTGARGLNFIGLSLHGPEPVHNHITGRDDAYAAAVEGVREVVALRTQAGKRCPILHVTAVICRDNLEVLPMMPRIVADMGVDILNLALELRMHDVPELGEADPDAISCATFEIPRIEPALLNQVLDETVAAAREASIELRLPRMPREAVLAYYQAELEIEQFECRSPWTNLYIGADGGVYPCFLHRVGSVREEPLKRIWNSPRMRTFRDRLRTQGPFCICDGCCELQPRK